MFGHFRLLNLVPMASLRDKKTYFFSGKRLRASRSDAYSMAKRSAMMCPFQETEGPDRRVVRIVNI